MHKEVNLHTINKSEISKISGGNDDFYRDVMRPMIEGVGVAALYGGGPNLIAGPGFGIALYGIEQFIALAPELGPALEDINRLNAFQVQDRLNNPYMYAD
ncbi:MAG: hypothetical protein U1E78_05345 [Gammaproteobacteria bacterium]